MAVIRGATGARACAQSGAISSARVRAATGATLAESVAAPKLLRMSLRTTLRELVGRLRPDAVSIDAAPATSVPVPAPAPERSSSVPGRAVGGPKRAASGFDPEPEPELEVPSGLDAAAAQIGPGDAADETEAQQAA